MDVIITGIYTFLIVIEVLLLGVIIFQPMSRIGKLWLAWLSGFIIIITAIQLLPSDWVLADRITRDYLLWIGLMTLLFGLGQLVLSDVTRDGVINTIKLGYMTIAGIWLIGYIVTSLLFEPVFMGWMSWNGDYAVIPALVGSVGALTYGLYVMGVSFYYFYTAPMPEVANRSAFWLVSTFLYLVGAVLVASGTILISLIGTIVLLVGVLTSFYAIRFYRLVDVRDALFVVAQSTSVIGIAWTLIFATMYFITISSVSDGLILENNNDSTLLLAGIALIIALIIVPARQVIVLIFKRFASHSTPNLANASAIYSQRVARAATLEEVVNATTETLNQVMGLSRSALILINNTVRVKDSVELIVLERGATIASPTSVGYLHQQSPVYHALAVLNVPIGQYDIDYSPSFESVVDGEKQFFRNLDMSVYVPVSADNRLIGLLAAGTKLNDTPYYREDIELLSVIGQQVGTALRSARLIDDLQHLNDSMRVLNKRLEGAKSELEKLDGIKTDFITIASHELRTPLAQIRGYTDIIDSLNQANALKEGQAATLVGNLRKSTERMEELISAMLDVSQIDVNSMDLRFIRTSAETITKMALEPLRDPAAEREITIVRHSAKELPNINADLQRMVQALRNLVLNAIKFTPDGGKIEISASLHEANEIDETDGILFKIQDTGVGIAEKDIEYIFDKFYRAFDTQLHSTGIYKFMGAGPGLGLTIAKGIIEGHGGRVWAESTGHDMEALPGSIFWVRLPLEPPSGTRRLSPFEQE